MNQGFRTEKTGLAVYLRTAYLRKFSQADWLPRRGIQRGIATLDIVILLWSDNKTATQKRLETTTF